MRHKLLLLSTLVFVLSLTTIYLWKENQELRNNKEREALSYCIESLQASSDLVNNCDAAYQEIGSCLTSVSTCNIEDSTSKLQSLNQEKNKINDRFQELSNKLKDTYSK